MPRFLFSPITGSLLAGLLLLAAAGCSGADEASAPAATAETSSRRSVRVETLVLQPTSFQDVIELTGSVEAVQDARLSAQASGTIVRLAERGAYVRAGEPVAQIDPALAQAAVQQAEATLSAAEAALALAEDSYRRQEPLFRDSVISALEFENVRAQRNQARAQVEQARAALAQAQEQFENTRVTAPFAGIVEERLVEIGEQVAPGTPVARVLNTERVKVTAGVPERYAGDIEVGTPVQVVLQAYGRQPRPGTVTFAGNAVNPQSRTFPIEIELGNGDGQLKPEMVARVLVTRERLDGVLVVPQSAVMREEDGHVLYVATRTDSLTVAERRAVTLGPGYDGRVVVTRGLEAGEEVVVLGQTNLTDGDALEVTERYTAVGPAGVPLKDTPAGDEPAPPATP